MAEQVDRLSIVVIGGSGDLARKKIFPALFALHCQGFLPDGYLVFGFARSRLSEMEFRTRIMEHLTCRYTPGESCGQLMDEFLGRCCYVSGNYDSRDSLLDLYQTMREAEGGKGANRFYYLAIPPSVFLGVSHAIGDAGLVNCGAAEHWSRVVIEKPFGSDRASSDELTRSLAEVFTEDQTYRIDHYLGKEVIQNLLVLRFANVVFDPLWNQRFIRKIEIVWKENIGLEGRGGYFDQYGIVRDVMQNHLMQILALVAMEPPDRLESTWIAAEKVKVLRCVPPLKLHDVVLGQYHESVCDGHRFPAYIEDPGVPDGSITPTFAAAKLQIDTPRWQGVPFFISAGKGVDVRMTEIRIHFREVPGNMFCGRGGCPEANQLIVRVQPEEAIYFSLVNKVPGMGMKVATRNLDLQYKEAFSELIPDAYESLLLDVVEGDRSLFIRSDELEAAWDIFTPVLHEIEERQVVPEAYEFGGPGPATAGLLTL